MKKTYQTLILDIRVCTWRDVLTASIEQTDNVMSGLWDSWFAN
jgi:hypothetical protein